MTTTITTTTNTTPSSFSTNTIKTYDQLYPLLQSSNQLHLLQYYDSLTPEQQQSLLSQLSLFDFDHLNQIFLQSTTPNLSRDEEHYRQISPPPKSCIDSLSHLSHDTHAMKKLYDRGIELLRCNQVAILLLAGGQGTRLGSKDPKGMYDMGLQSHKSLFQIQTERILRLQKLAGENCEIPYYVLTSPQNDEETRVYFEENDYFGLKKSQTYFFSQESLPCFDFDGKIMMENEFTLAMAPNGNGGVYQALEHSMLYADMLGRGIKHIHSYSIDNVLVKPADPIFMAFCADRGVDFGTKVVPKAEPHERVGVFALKNGRFHVVEYSEISKEMAERRDAETGELAFNAANIVNFYYSIDFLHTCARQMDIHKIYHVAKKTVSCIDDVNPTKPNGIKLELFNFDICEFADNVAILEVDRELEFSPLKNGPNEGLSDSPETCRQDLSRVCKLYIKQAGGRFTNENDNGKPVIEQPLCEISPLLSYAGEGLEELVKDKEFTLPLLLQ